MVNQAFEDVQAQFKENTKSDIRHLQCFVENKFLKSSNNDTAKLESIFLEELETTRQNVNDNLDQMKRAVLDKKPATNAPDFEVKNAEYAQLLSVATKGFTMLREWIKSLFDQVMQVIKSIISWIAENITVVANAVGNFFIRIWTTFF
ncbi:unnamed protein product [Adineta ricciae]|uniref:Uncharacterized protein n=1 Tax=Adineta ricciae TaxID=249248 RepID=A0A816DRE2_ADIRI|nr:unnamed protein product [Adineta ricciae]